MNRDSGDIMWRFFAAARPKLVLSNWGSESTQPAIGTVSVVDGLLWVNAGRHVEIGHGITWWALDQALARSKSRAPSPPAPRSSTRQQRKRDRSKSMVAADRSKHPWVSDGKVMVLERAGVFVDTGKTPSRRRLQYRYGLYGYNHNAPPRSS